MHSAGWLKINPSARARVCCKSNQIALTICESDGAGVLTGGIAADGRLLADALVLDVPVHLACSLCLCCCLKRRRRYINTRHSTARCATPAHHWYRIVHDCTNCTRRSRHCLIGLGKKRGMIAICDATGSTNTQRASLALARSLN